MKQVLKFSLLLAFSSLFYLNSNAQVVVRVRPPRPNVVITNRPPAPSPHHVWVDEDWRVRGRHYQWHGGYWAKPPRASAVWVPGHWSHRRGGEMWIAGHWRY